MIISCDTAARRTWKARQPTGEEREAEAQLASSTTEESRRAAKARRARLKKERRRTRRVQGLETMGSRRRATGTSALEPPQVRGELTNDREAWREGMDEWAAHRFAGPRNSEDVQRARLEALERAAAEELERLRAGGQLLEVPLHRFLEALGEAASGRRGVERTRPRWSSGGSARPW